MNQIELENYEKIIRSKDLALRKYGTFFQYQKMSKKKDMKNIIKKDLKNGQRN